MYLQNKYTKWYYSIISRAQNRAIEGYVEKHHIIPKSLGGKNSKDNLVKLTPKEHRLCHILLTKMTLEKSKDKMIFAAKRMSDKCIKVLGMSRGSYYNLLREQVREAVSRLNKGRPAKNKGTKHSEAVRLLCGSFAKGKTWYNNGLVENTFFNNPPCGWVKGRLKQSVRIAGHNSRSILFRGKLYPSISAAVKDTGISPFFIKKELVPV